MQLQVKSFLAFGDHMTLEVGQTIIFCLTPFFFMLLFIQTEDDDDQGGDGGIMMPAYSPT
jgi:hypothetical protein